MPVTSFKDWKSSWIWQRQRVTLFLYHKAIYQAWSSVVKENYSDSQIDQDECAPTLNTLWVSLKREVWIPNKPQRASAYSWTHPPSFSLKGTMLELSQARHFVGVNFVLLQPGYYVGKLQFSNCCKYKHHLAFANNNIIRGYYKIINSQP